MERLGEAFDVQPFTKGLRDGVAIGLGYLSVSFSFGINAAQGGLTILQTALISMTNLTSAGQLAGLNLMIALAPLAELFLVQLTINIRYALMSMSLTQKLDNSMTFAHRLGAAFFITDEVFAVASSQSGLIGRSYLYGLATMPYMGWALGTLLGAAAGSLLPASVTTALGIAIYGMFIAIIVPPMKKLKAVRLVVLVALGLNLALKYIPLFDFISDGVAIVLCSVVAAGVGAYCHPAEEGA